MTKLEELLSGLAQNADIAILNPTAVERLKAQGVNIPEPPKRTLKESINLLLEKRKNRALEIAKKLPEPPPMASPSIESLYNEIREAVIFGLNGAAITLSGILVEYVLKYATYKVEIGGFAKYDAAKADEFERMTLAPAIDRAAKAGLLKSADVEKLKLFKDRYRNPYNHYNIKKITDNYYLGDVSILNLKTNEVETRDIAARDDPIIQAQLKPYVDADNVLAVFVFADSVVKSLWLKIKVPKESDSIVPQA